MKPLEAPCDEGGNGPDGLAPVPRAGRADAVSREALRVFLRNVTEQGIPVPR